MAKSSKNSNGAGSIQYYPDRKKYRAFFSTPAGNRISKTFESRAAAEDWITIQKASRIDGTFVEPSDYTFGTWMIEYLATYETSVTERTQENYIQLATYLEPLTAIPLQKLSAPILQGFFNNVKKRGRKPSKKKMESMEIPQPIIKEDMSVNGKHKLLMLVNSALKKACEVGLLKFNPADVVTIPKLVQPKIEVFEEEEVQRLLSFVETNKYYKRYYPLILTAVTSGCRLGELRALRIVDVGKDRIYINKTLQRSNGITYEKLPKTETSFREVLLPDKVIMELRKAYKEEPLIVGGYVFHTSSGKPWGNSNIERAWKKILELAELPHHRFHSLRHTHATKLLHNGIPILEVAKRLGHKNANVTLEVYGHAMESYEETMLNKLEELYK